MAKKTPDIAYPTPRTVIRLAIGSNGAWQTDPAKASFRRTLAWFVWLEEDEQKAFIKLWNGAVSSLPNFNWMSLFDLLGEAAAKWPEILKHDERIKKERGRNGHHKPAPEYKHEPLTIMDYSCINCEEPFSAAEPPLYCPLCGVAGWRRG